MPAGPTERFRVQATGECIKCGRQARGWIAFGDHDPSNPDQGPSVIVDTGGFMAFASGVVCDPCLGAGDASNEESTPP